MTRDEVLAELRYLATVEHALCVDYLQIHYALGGDTEDAGQAAMRLAETEMVHIRAVNEVLVQAGSTPELGRASHVIAPDGRAIAVGAFAPEQFAGFPLRESSIASAVDLRYEHLRPAVAPPSPLFEGMLLEQITSLLDSAAHHAEAVPGLAKLLADMQPSEFLRATRVEPADAFERDMLAASNQFYQAIVAALRAWFAHDDEPGVSLRGVAVSTMFSLRDVSGHIAARGLVPGFAVTN